MEKVIIKTCVDSGRKSKDGNPLITIELEDGRKCTAYVADAVNWIGEMELEIKPGKNVSGVQYYNVFKPDKNTKYQASMRDYTFEKRNASLQRAIETATLLNIKSTSKDILAVAEKYYTYLNLR